MTKAEKVEIQPQRWHLYIIDLEPRVGTKPGKQRPCISVQPTELSQGGLGSTVVIPLTTKTIRHSNTFPLRVSIPKGTCGLEHESDALITQILAWDHQLFREDLGTIPVTLQLKVKEALKDFLDL